MKKYLLIAGLGLVTTVGVTAAVMSKNSGKKKTTQNTSKKCAEKSHCTKSAKVCFF